MNNIKEQTVSEIAFHHPQSYRVFSRYNIDFCCGGKRKLADVCDEKSISIDEFISDLEELETHRYEEEDWGKLSQTELVQHIVETHHDYLREELSRLHQLAQKVARVHGNRDPHLLDVLSVFRKMAGELLDHLEKEEQVLFSLVIDAEKMGVVDQRVLIPIQVMESDHEETGAYLEELAKLTGNYEIKPGMCNSYQALYKGLKHLEQDTKIHIHKENNILFPRTLDAVRKSA